MSKSPKLNSQCDTDSHSVSDIPVHTHSNVNDSDLGIITICKNSRTFQYVDHKPHLSSAVCPSSSSTQCSSSTGVCSSSSSSSPRLTFPSHLSFSHSLRKRLSSSSPPPLHVDTTDINTPVHRRKISCCKKVGLTVRRWWFNTWDMCIRQFS